MQNEPEGRTNRAAHYLGAGEIGIVVSAIPELPPGGLIVRSQACGLCSGELMAWYMDRKIPHVLGHEVSGTVEASDDPRFPVGARVFPHHHAPCLECDLCRTGRYVHCPQWRGTKLLPGGMADFFAVPAANLMDCLIVDDLRPVDAALIEPVACVLKSIRSGPRIGDGAAVIGLGAMGLMHALLLPGCVAYDLNENRRNWAREHGIDARDPAEAEEGRALEVFVCPGSQAAFDFALRLAAPAAEITLFAPMPPGEDLRVPQLAYFRDLAIRNAYSCGPDDTSAAADVLRRGALTAEQVVTDFVAMPQLPEAYGKMKRGEILKAMVVWN